MQVSPANLRKKLDPTSGMQYIILDRNYNIIRVVSLEWRKRLPGIQSIVQ